jgi:hypothetical protein
MSNNNTSSGGIGFCGLLAIAFIVLKLTKYINWSWQWVLSPVWMPIALWAIVVIGSLLFVSGVKVFSTKKQRAKMKRIREDEKPIIGKSKWQQRMEQMQEGRK